MLLTNLHYWSINNAQKFINIRTKIIRVICWKLIISVCLSSLIYFIYISLLLTFASFKDKVGCNTPKWSKLRCDPNVDRFFTPFPNFTPKITPKIIFFIFLSIFIFYTYLSFSSSRIYFLLKHTNTPSNKLCTTRSS